MVGGGGGGGGAGDWDEDGEDDVWTRQGRGGGGGGRRRRGGGRTQSFRLKKELQFRKKAGDHGSGEENDVDALKELFPLMEKDLIQQAYKACGLSIEAAANSLLTMSMEQTRLHDDGGEASTSSSSSFVPWDSLPHECKRIVFELLAPRDAACAAAVSRDFAALAREQRSRVTSLTLTLSATANNTISNAASSLAALVAAHPALRTLSLRKCGSMLKDFQGIFEAAAGASFTSAAGKVAPLVRAPTRSLESIDLRGCGHLQDVDVAIVCCLHSKLRHLDLSNCEGITDAALKFLGRYPSNGAARVADIASSGLPVEDIALCPPAASAAASADTGATAFEQFGVRSLVVAGCEQTTNNGVQALLRSTALVELDISRLPHLTPQALRPLVSASPASLLKSLRAAACPLFAPGLALHLPASARLEDLNLSACTQLEWLHVSGARLKSVQLAQCRHLRSLSLACPNLTSLSLSQARLLHNCAALEEFDRFECPRTCSLSLSGMRTLSTQAARAIVSNCASSLKALDITGCRETLQLAGAQLLETIDASGCASLRSLTISDAFHLHTLKAHSCKALREIALAGCERLRLVDVTNCVQLRALRISPTPVMSERGGSGRVKISMQGCLALPRETVT
eukprot:jgi/Chlat1/1127/Chrsp111S01599